MASATATNATLQILKMSDNKLSAGVAPALRAIGESTSLTQLDLSENKLGPDACADLAAGIAKNASLRELELNYCALGAGCAALGDALKSNSTLTSLELNDNGSMKAEAALLRDAFRRRAERLRKELAERGEKHKAAKKLPIHSTIDFLFPAKSTKLESVGHFAIEGVMGNLDPVEHKIMNDVDFIDFEK